MSEHEVDAMETQRQGLVLAELTDFAFSAPLSIGDARREIGLRMAIALTVSRAVASAAEVVGPRLQEYVPAIVRRGIERVGEHASRIGHGDVPILLLAATRSAAHERLEEHARDIAVRASQTANRVERELGGTADVGVATTTVLTQIIKNARNVHFTDDVKLHAYVRTAIGRELARVATKAPRTDSEDDVDQFAGNRGAGDLDGEDYAYEREFADIVRTCVQMLPPRQRDAIGRSAGHDHVKSFTSAERTALKNGRRQLRALLAKRGIHLPTPRRH